MPAQKIPRTAAPRATSRAPRLPANAAARQPVEPSARTAGPDTAPAGTRSSPTPRLAAATAAAKAAATAVLKAASGALCPPPAERLTERKRAAILQAAIAEFQAAGYEATGVDKVAARAEVSKRTLYNHFPSKEELFAAALEALWHTDFTPVELPYQPEAPLQEQLVAQLLQKLARLSDGNFLALARVAVAATIHAPERAQHMVARIGQKEGGLLAWVSAAQKDGRLRPGDAAAAVQQLESLVKGTAFWPQVTMGVAPLTPRAQRQLAISSAELFLSGHALD